MYAVAIVGDVLSFIPGVNIFSGFCTMIALSIIGAETRVNLWSPERAGATLVVSVLEFVPGVAMVPAWTFRVWLAKRNQEENGI